MKQGITLDDQSSIAGSSPASRSKTIVRATTKDLRSQARNFVDKHHSYIKWADRPSRKLYWLLFEDDKHVGVFGLASAFARPKSVMDYMAEHGLAFNEVGNNIVYCLAGHVDKNAGTRLLRLVRQDAAAWWYERYGDSLRAMQCFILPPRTGALYKADNWQQLGYTTGGRTLVTRTLYGEDRGKHPEAEIRTFKSGEVKYLLREWAVTEPKLIFMRLLRRAR